MQSVGLWNVHCANIPLKKDLDKQGKCRLNPNPLLRFLWLRFLLQSVNSWYVEFPIHIF